MSIKIDWTDPNPLETGYKVYRATSPLVIGSMPAPLTSLPANTTTYTDAAVTNGTTYYYRISAYDGVGEQFSAQISILAQQILTLTFPGSANDRYTYSVVIGGTTFSYKATTGQTISDVRTNLAALIDADAAYVAVVSTPNVLVTGTGITTSTVAVTVVAPEADQRAFFWYNPATNTSVFADKLDTYFNNDDGTSETGPVTKFAPEDSWLASISQGYVSGSALTWYTGQTASEARLLASPQPTGISGYFPSGGMIDRPAAMGWDPTTSDVLVMSYNAGGDVVKERRFNSAGVVTSTTTVTVGGSSTYQFFPWMMVKFLGQWRAFTDNYGLAYYFKRNASSADWTRYTESMWGLTDTPGYGKYTVGADTLSSGTVLVALVDNVDPAPAQQPHYINIMRTTDGETWTKQGPSRLLNNADGLCTTTGEVGWILTAADTYGSRLQRIGSVLGYYFATTATGGAGPGTFVLKSNADGTVWTTSKITVDGSAFTGRLSHICSNSDGSAVVATNTVGLGTSSCVSNMLKSTDGINFTTLPNSAIHTTGYATGATDYKAIPNSQVGDLRAPLLSSGTKILFERLLRKD